MADSKPKVVIGDADAARAEWLGRFLSDYYKADVTLKDTFAKVSSFVRNSTPHSTPDVIFLTDTLPISEDELQPTPYINFGNLHYLKREVRLACIVTGDDYPEMKGVRAPVCYVPIASPKRADEERDQIKKALQPLQDVMPLANVSIEEVSRRTGWDAQDRGLCEQIQSLSGTRDPVEGERILHNLLRDSLNWNGVEGVRVEPLTQGKSGALVLRLGVTTQGEGDKDETEVNDYVLKITNTKDLWKLESEVNGYVQASKSDLYSTYKRHVPELRTPWASKSSSERGPRREAFRYIASHLPWEAIYYDFLGGPIGECMSFDAAFTSSADVVRRRTAGNVRPEFKLASAAPEALRNFRLTFLHTLLGSLCDIWYLNGEFVRRKPRRLWEAESAGEQDYVPLPPYKLTGRSKRWVKEFLDGEEALIGSRLFGEWGDCRARILDFTGGDPKKLGPLGEERPVTLSPSHGDLNAGNVFLWLKHERFPFLIDLPFYQREGHVLQDFARLEVELKFGLMDRQAESPEDALAAFDYSPSQVPLWRELEDNLLNDSSRGGEPGWLTGGFRDNVSLTYEAVQIVRNKAEQAQRQPCPDGAVPPLSFMDEYLPALLYHTLRAITYTSLSLFKRMLAVYSAGAILRRLGL
jgi:hypothetical protein